MFGMGLKNDKNDARGIYTALEMGVREVPVKSAAIRDLALLQTMRTKRQREKVEKLTTSEASCLGTG